MRFCHKCSTEKSEEEFYTNKSRKSGYQSYCKSCLLEYAKTDAGKASRRVHKAKKFDYYSICAKIRKIMQRYGLTVERYLSYFDLQDDKCLNPNCLATVEPYTKNACVDHEHTTPYLASGRTEYYGEVRGILCQKCNSNLGWFENNRAWIELYVR